MNRNPIAVFVHDKVGYEILLYLLEFFPQDVSAAVVLDQDSKNMRIHELLDGYPKVEKINYSLLKNHSDLDLGRSRLKNINYFFLCWWPEILSKELVELPKYGVINTHPSFLPYCRGKDPNFWAIVEQVPFGVSLHQVSDKVDSGAIIYQERIEYGWTDTGQTLYEKAVVRMIELFKSSYPQIRKRNYSASCQDLSIGKMHLRKDLQPASEIRLDHLYSARDLINLLRARTFPPHPACWFVDDGEKFEVTITVRKLES